MEKNGLAWSGKRLMERWGIYSTELGSYIYEGLPAYRMEGGKFHQVPPEEVNHFDADHMTDFVFNPEDVLNFEKEHGLIPIQDSKSDGDKLPPEDARELGQLRAQKERMDITIAAAVHVGIFCAEIGRPIVRREAQDFVNEFDMHVTDISIDKMWRALPEKYRKGPGRPRKE